MGDWDLNEAGSRKRAARELRDALDGDSRQRNERLWDCIKAYQGYIFETAGRGRNRVGAVAFSYRLKISRRTGQPNDEIIISRKENSKSLTRSSVEIALANGLQEQRTTGCVSGPKKLKVFGASYLYAMFLEWGIIVPRAELPSQTRLVLDEGRALDVP